jgi:predicted O-methyltransferase YrrM
LIKELPLYQRKVLQDPAEIDEFCRIVKAEQVRSYLEIGAKFGGSFWKVATSLPVGSRVVAIDMPNGTVAWKESRQSLSECAVCLAKLGYDANVIWGDSQNKDIIEAAKVYGPFDCIFIDADHRLPGVTSDWINYAELSNKLVVFHDIAWRRAPEWDGGYRIDVPKLWDEIKGDFKYKEIKYCHTGKDNGIGVLWMNGDGSKIRNIRPAESS